MPTLSSAGGGTPSAAYRVDRISGAKFSTTATVLTLEPGGLDSICRIPTTVGGSNDMVVETITSNLTCTITTSGAGGLHSDYTESANQGYDVYYISDGASTKNLIMVERGDLPVTTWALPSGYTRWRRVWFSTNDGSSDLRSFDSDLTEIGICRYTTTGEAAAFFGAGIQVLTAGTATSLTAIDVTEIMPKGVDEFGCMTLAINTTAASNGARFAIGNANNYIVQNLDCNGFSTRTDTTDGWGEFDGPIDDDNLYYFWFAAPSTGFYVTITTWRLPR